MKNKIIIVIVFSSLLVYGQTDTFHLSEAKSIAVSFNHGEELFFMGGTPDNKKVEIFNCQTNSFTHLSEPFLDGFTKASAIKNGNKVFLYNLQGVNLTIIHYYLFDIETKKASRHKWPSNIGSTFSSQLAYQVGNEVVFLSSSNDSLTYRYNTITEQWQYGLIPFKRRNVRVIYAAEKIFFIGGNEGNFNTGRVDVYNKNDNSWDVFGLTQSRNNYAVLHHNDKIIIAGGNDTAILPSSDLIEIIDINNYDIDTLSLAKDKYKLTAIGFKNKVYLGGGNSKEIEIINLENLSKEILTLDANNNLDKLQSKSFKDHLFFFGGNIQDDGKKIYIYDSRNDLWHTQYFDQPMTRISAVTTDRKFALAGGQIYNSSTYSYDFSENLYLYDTCTLYNRNYYVDMNASDPYNDFEMALSNSCAYDTIMFRENVVDPFTFEQKFTVDKTLTFLGEGTSNTILKFQRVPGITIPQNKLLTLQNLTIFSSKKNPELINVSGGLNLKNVKIERN